MAPTRTRLRVNAAAAAIFGAASVAGGACVWSAGPALRGVLSDLLTFGVDQIQLMLSQVADVIATLAAVTPALQSTGASTADITASSNELQSAADEVNSALDSYEDTIADGLKRLMQGCSILGALLILLVLLAWLGHALAPRRGAKHLTGGVNFFQWLFLVLGWVICGITYILYLIVSDACLALPAALDNPVKAGLASTLPCLDPVFAADASSAARAPIFEAVDAANAALAFCGPNGPTNPYLCSPVVASFNGTYIYTDRAGACATGYTTPLASFAAAYTATTCPNPAVQSQLVQLGAAVAAAAQLYDVMPQVDDLVSCAFVTDTLEGVEERCGALRAGVRALFGGLLLSCIAFSALLCAGVWAYRFAYLPREEQQQQAAAGKLADDDVESAPVSTALADYAEPPASNSKLAAADVSGKK